MNKNYVKFLIKGKILLHRYWLYFYCDVSDLISNVLTDSAAKEVMKLKIWKCQAESPPTLGGS